MWIASAPEPPLHYRAPRPNAEHRLGEDDPASAWIQSLGRPVGSAGGCAGKSSPGSGGARRLRLACVWFVVGQQTSPVDLVLFTVKLYDTEEAAAALASLIARHTRVLTIQNGIDGVDIISRFARKDQVFAGVTYLASTVVRSGVSSTRADFAVSWSMRPSAKPPSRLCAACVKERHASTSKPPTLLLVLCGRSLSGSRPFLRRPALCARRRDRCSRILKHGPSFASSWATESPWQKRPAVVSRQASPKAPLRSTRRCRRLRTRLWPKTCS